MRDVESLQSRINGVCRYTHRMIMVPQRLAITAKLQVGMEILSRFPGAEPVSGKAIKLRTAGGAVEMHYSPHALVRHPAILHAGKQPEGEVGREPVHPVYLNGDIGRRHDGGSRIVGVVAPDLHGRQVAMELVLEADHGHVVFWDKAAR